MTRAELEAVLGRAERNVGLIEPLGRLAGERVLITGAAGSIGLALNAALRWSALVLPTDIDTLDVRDLEQSKRIASEFAPSLVFHLAGAKHAPEGEIDPWAVCETNTIGTRNVLDAFPDSKVVLASTCKACDPETAYGASKLIAERMVLNAGGTVARFYNVVETQGNVFEKWRALPESAPIPVTRCARYFISLQEAVALLLWAAVLPTGRYSVDAGLRPRQMETVAAALYRDRKFVLTRPRRGDRRVEPRVARSEQTVKRAGVIPLGLKQEVSAHDAVRLESPGEEVPRRPEAAEARA